MWLLGGMEAFLCARKKMTLRRRRKGLRKAFRAVGLTAVSSAQPHWQQPRAAEWLAARARRYFACHPRDIMPVCSRGHMAARAHRPSIYCPSSTVQARSSAHMPARGHPSRTWATFGAWKEGFIGRMDCFNSYLHDVM